MLTNVYYFNIYQPYIMQKRTGSYTAKTVLERYAQSAQNTAKAQVTKNNAIKRDVVDYVGAVCRNVTEMKDNSKYLALNAEHYYLNVLNESLETAKKWAEEDVSMFVNAYNAAVEFGIEQEHSPELKRYAEDLREIVISGRENLSAAGVNIRDAGMRMTFDPSGLHTMDYLQFGKSVLAAAQTASEVYGRTSELMLMPAAAHMDFHQLSYYYNYRIDQMQDAKSRSTANLYTGIVLDKAI